MEKSLIVSLAEYKRGLLRKLDDGWRKRGFLRIHFRKMVRSRESEGITRLEIE